MWIVELALGLYMLAAGLPAAESQRIPLEFQQTRGLLSTNAWPLTEGPQRALEIVKSIRDGRQQVTIDSNQVVYYGGGISMRPADALYTTITVNWKMIQDELEAEAQPDALQPGFFR